MNNQLIDKIFDYLKVLSRNRIIFHSEEIEGLVSIDMGQKVSDAMYLLRNADKIHLRISMEIDSILNASIYQHPLWGKCLSIKNLGILFEPELKIDFVRLLDSFSQNNVLFIKWEGEFDTENVYFLTTENGIKINIKNLSHIVI